jgi:hypothetical protein
MLYELYFKNDLIGEMRLDGALPKYRQLFANPRHEAKTSWNTNISKALPSYSLFEIGSMIIKEKYPCPHKHTISGAIKETSTDFELCLSCGLSRAIYEQESSNWTHSEVAGEAIILRQKKQEQVMDHLQELLTAAKEQLVTERSKSSGLQQRLDAATSQNYCKVCGKDLDRYTPKDEETKNRPQYVLFDPVAVGWGKGLTKAIENAKNMNVPLAVITQYRRTCVKRAYPDLDVIIIDKN